MRESGAVTKMKDYASEDAIYADDAAGIITAVMLRMRCHCGDDWFVAEMIAAIARYAEREPLVTCLRRYAICRRRRDLRMVCLPVCLFVTHTL